MKHQSNRHKILGKNWGEGHAPQPLPLLRPCIYTIYNSDKMQSCIITINNTSNRMLPGLVMNVVFLIQRSSLIFLFNSQIFLVRAQDFDFWLSALYMYTLVFTAWEQKKCCVTEVRQKSRFMWLFF